MFIADLPVELISKICHYLDFQEMIALRLSCRALYKHSLENFARTVYRTTRFIVTSKSLQKLEELSQSNGLCEHVQELWMIPIVFNGTEQPLGMVSISSKICRPVKGDGLEIRHAVHKAMLADNSNLLESEAFSVRLRQCMDRFKNLQTIGLAHYPTEFLLDPRQQTVSFLGRRQMMSQIDFRFDVYRLQAFTHTHPGSQIRKLNSLALSKLFLALCGSSCRPRKLYTCDSNLCGDIGPRIALSEEQFESLPSTLKGLEELHLCIDLNEAAWLKLLTKLAPQLKGLVLSQDHMPAYPAGSYLESMFHDINFTRLRELHIHDLDIYFNSLKSLLLSVKENLVTLTLERVKIHSEELRPAENPRSQHSESPGHQEDERPFPWMSTNRPYGAGLSSTLPTLQYTPPAPHLTSPSYVPIVPSIISSLPFAPTAPRPEYGPAPLPVRPTSETAWAESTPQSPRHSLTSESSELPTEEYTSEQEILIYHLYQFAQPSVCPTLETQMAWKRNEEKVTCVFGLFDTLQNELSLESLSLEDIVCDGNYYYFERVNSRSERSGRVDFDIRKSNLSLKDWISHLTLIPYCPGNRILTLKKDKEMKGWFDKMIGKDSGSFKRLD